MIPPPHLTELAKRLTAEWRPHGVSWGTGFGLDDPYGGSDVATWGLFAYLPDHLLQGPTQRWQLLPKRIGGFPVRIRGIARALGAVPADASPSWSPSWLPGATAEVLWTPAPLVLLPSSPELAELTKWLEGPSAARPAARQDSAGALARGTLQKALDEAPVRPRPPHGTRVACRFFWRDGAPGAECSCGDAAVARRVSVALERFWEVDLQRFGGENIAKWKKIATQRRAR
jgi:hypothetical protein